MLTLLMPTSGVAAFLLLLLVWQRILLVPWRLLLLSRLLVFLSMLRLRVLTLYCRPCMPGGIPVATVAIGKAGAKNAAYLAAQILATADSSLAELVKAERAESAKAVQAKDAALQAKLNQNAS